jgi:hypothetical protein
MKELKIIENYIKKNKNGISFAEIERELETNNINPKGNYWLPYKSYKNMYIWINMSENFIKAIITLFKEFKIQLVECSPIVYLVDGLVLNLPIARGKERDYTQEHWLPMIIHQDKRGNHQRCR